MASRSDPTIWWARRDLRLNDNPALRAAIGSGVAVLPLFVLDPVLLRSPGTGRYAWLMAALHSLDADLRAAGGPGLSVLQGKPAAIVPQVAEQIGARQVHVSADFAPYGRSRDAAVAAALQSAGMQLMATGSPYAVAPGTLFTQSGGPFQVFSPFHRTWMEHGVHGPAPAVEADRVTWLAAADRVTADEPDPDLLPRVGEAAAHRGWQEWLHRDPRGVDDYADLHNDPGADATSHLSAALRWGHLHPRTVLADLHHRPSRGAAAIARQVAWRDFFADVLYHRPTAVSEPVREEFTAMAVDDPEPGSVAATRLEAWRQGRTGFPLVDAGMRQLLAEGWMHNRVRLVTASFLIKDLHIGWWHGADWFMEKLIDGDIAQNQLNWQWVAGCGTDPAPYFRIFNPTGQAEKFDPDGVYIRRYVSELSDVAREHLHTPAACPGGPPAGYPAPIVDHAAERKESLLRYANIRR